jgi:ribonuclease Z
MTTYAIVTGTGHPPPDSMRAGPGVLVISDGLYLQFDCGRGTTMRHAAINVHPTDITAVFLTHYHSDHVVGLPDLALSRWEVEYPTSPPYRPLEIVAPCGAATRFALTMLTPYKDNMDVRAGHTAPRNSRAEVRVNSFVPCWTRPRLVWSQRQVRVYAIAVEHCPVENAVAYKVCTPDHNIVISGDTRVCWAIERLCRRRTDTVIHEALLHVDGAQNRVGVRDYHSDSLALGQQMSRLSVGQLVLTHLIPAPRSREHEQQFIDSIRQGGYCGPLTVARDMTLVELPVVKHMSFEGIMSYNVASNDNSSRDSH